MSSEYMIALGESIREVRKAKRYTISEVRCQTRMTHQAIAKIERGSVHPRLDNLFKICQVLEVNPSTLFVMAESRL